MRKLEYQGKCARCGNPMELRDHKFVSDYYTQERSFFVCGYCKHEEELEIQSAGLETMLSSRAWEYNRRLNPDFSGIRGGVFTYFRVTVRGAEGSVDDVRVNTVDIKHCKGNAKQIRKLVGDAAFYKMMYECDPRTSEPYDSNHAVLLRKIVRSLGILKAKERFISAIEFEQTHVR